MTAQSIMVGTCGRASHGNWKAKRVARKKMINLTMSSLQTLNSRKKAPSPQGSITSLSAAQDTLGTKPVIHGLCRDIADRNYSGVQVECAVTAKCIPDARHLK